MIDHTAHPPSDTMTYEAFLERADVPEHAEWVDGRVVAVSPGSTEHQDLGGFLFVLFRHFVEAGDLGKVLAPPFQMKTGSELPGREPDLLFVAKDRLHLLKKNHFAGPADLAIEIVSPDSRTRDSRDKFAEYERGGVREYWLLDQPRREAKLFELTGIPTDEPAARRYRPIAPDENGILRSRVLPGLWVDTDWLWADPRPKLLDVLRRWGLV